MSKTWVPYLNVEASRALAPSQLTKPKAEPKKSDGKGGRAQEEFETSPFPDQGLFERFGGQTFPYCVFMDSEGEILFEVNPKNEVDLRRAHRAAQLLLELRKKSTAQPKTHASRFSAELLDAIGRRQRPAISMKRQRALSQTEGMHPEVLRLFQVDAFDNDFIQALRDARGSDDRAGQLIMAMFRQGRQPMPGTRNEVAFYYYCARASLDERKLGSAEGFLRKLEKLAKKLRPSIRSEVESELRRMKQRLSRLQTEAPKKTSKPKAEKTLDSPRSPD